MVPNRDRIVTPGTIAAAGSQRDPGSLPDKLRGVTGSFWGRIAAGSGCRIALGQVLGRDRIVLEQDRSGNKLRDRFGDVAGSIWGRIAAGSGYRIAPGHVLERCRILLGQDRSGIRLQDRCGGRIGAVAGADRTS